MFDLPLHSQTEAPVFIDDSVEANKDNVGNPGLGLFSLLPHWFKILYIYIIYINMMYIFTTFFFIYTPIPEYTE